MFVTYVRSFGLYFHISHGAWLDLAHFTSAYTLLAQACPHSSRISFVDFDDIPMMNETKRVLNEIQVTADIT